MSFPSSPGEAMEIGSGRRLVAAPDALSMEVRSRGAWVRSRVIPYEDIRAVYRFKVADKNAWVIIGVIGLALLGATIYLGAVAGWQGAMGGLVALMMAAVLAGLGLFRTRSSPAMLLRIEAYSGTLTVPDRSPAFYQSVAARLTTLRTSDTSSASGIVSTEAVADVPPDSAAENNVPG